MQIIITLIAGQLFTPNLFARGEREKHGESAEFFVDWAPVRGLNPYTITPSGEPIQEGRVYEIACVARHILCTSQQIVVNDDLLEVGSVGPDGKPRITASYGNTRLFPLTEGKNFSEAGRYKEWNWVTHHFLVKGTAPDGTIPVLIETKSPKGKVLRKEIRYFDPKRPSYWTRIEFLPLN